MEELHNRLYEGANQKGRLTVKDRLPSLRLRNSCGSADGPSPSAASRAAEALETTPDQNVCEATRLWANQDGPQSLWQPHAALQAQARGYKAHLTTLFASFNKKVLDRFPTDEGI